jgi:hypothetical protein
MNVQDALADSVRYLASDEALRAIEANVYWPKWDAPWWHLTLLHEMGEVSQAPERAVRKLVQALSGWGIRVDEELPWMREWFLRYQLPDGGLNCDEQAYLQDPPPSSMVATISPLEAVLFHTPRPFTPEEQSFVDKGARCLLDRQLMHATTSPHNAEEREDEDDWLKLCFPRFYLYDVLRGLSFVLGWAVRRGQSIPGDSVRAVAEHLERHYPDGQVRIERRSYDGISTKVESADWNWKHRQPASHFPLLAEVSRVGAISPHLSAQWRKAKARMGELKQRGLWA